MHYADDLDHDERARYHTANGEARRYVEALERRFLRSQRIGDMLDELRRFYRLSLEAQARAYRPSRCLKYAEA